MRAVASCVLVGRRTAELDRPRLDARGVGASRQPRPVVLDPGLSLHPSWPPPGSLILCSEQAKQKRAAAFEEQGLELAICSAGDQGWLEWESVLSELQRRGLGIVMVEGGAAVASSLMAAGWPHRLHLFLAPRLLGHEGPGLSAYGGPERDYVTHRLRRVGGDVEWVLRRPELLAPPSEG